MALLVVCQNAECQSVIVHFLCNLIQVAKAVFRTKECARKWIDAPHLKGEFASKPLADAGRFDAGFHADGFALCGRGPASFIFKNNNQGIKN